MVGMARRARRAQRSLTLRLEGLETRALLAGDLPAVGPTSPIDPATSLLVRFAANAGALSAVGGWVAQTFPDGTDVVGLSAGVDPAAALGRLKADPAFAFAEPDSPIQAAGIPNDPRFPLEWGLNNGNNVDIDAP